MRDMRRVKHEAPHAVLRNMLVPLARGHRDNDSQYFTALELEAVAKHFIATFFGQYHLYVFVLTRPRPQETSTVAELVEVPYLPPFDGVALPGVLSSRPTYRSPILPYSHVQLRADHSGCAQCPGRISICPT